MKKTYSLLVSLCLMLHTANAQTSVSQTINYSGFQGCGGCTVCGSDYWCINTPGSYCGNTAPCDSKVFFDPVPAGKLITNIQINYWTAGCAGSVINADINGQTYPAVNEANTGCLCSNAPCALSASTSNTYPCGIPAYNYGANNTLQLCTGAGVCVNRIELVITYVNPDVINPVITTSGPLTFCQGGSVNLDVGPGYPAYSWSNGATTQDITVATSGTYTCTVTSTTGCNTGNVSATVTVNTVPPTFTPTVTNNGTICSGNTVTITAPPTAGVTTNVYTTPTGGSPIGTVNFTSPVLNANTTYYFETVSAAGCFSSTTRDVVNITVNPTPTPIITTSNSTVCSGLTGTYTTSSTGGSLIWTVTGGTINSGQGTNTIDVLWGNNATGTVTVEETSTAGCKNTNIVNVTVNSTPTAFNPTIGSNDTICAGNTINITNTATAGVTTTVYDAFVGGNILGTVNFTSPILNNTTTYYFETVSTQGCFSASKRDSITITVNPLPAVPTIISMGNDSICIGLKDSIKTTPIAGVVTNVYTSALGGTPIGTLNYETAPIVANTTYYFETKIVSTKCLSKTVRDSITIVALPRPAKSTLTLTPNDSLCLGDSVQLKSSTNLPNTIKWYTSTNGGINLGKDSIYVSPTNTQYYYAEVKNTFGCKSSEARDSILITVLPLPNTPTITANVKPICETDSIVLYASITPATSTIYWLTSTMWKDTIAKGTSFTSPNLIANTTYYVAAQTNQKCRGGSSTFITIPVIVKPLPHGTISTNVANNIAYAGQSVVFECTPTTYDIYKWYIDANKVYEGGYYYETQDVKNEQDVKVQMILNGCENWADNKITMTVQSASNAFTPNGDGKNDLFLKGLDLTIFNRWGQVLYIGKDGWDGKYNGAAVSPGTYFYIVKTTKKGSSEVTEKSGALTLILD